MTPPLTPFIFQGHARQTVLFTSTRSLEFVIFASWNTNNIPVDLVTGVDKMHVCYVKGLMILCNKLCCHLKNGLFTVIELFVANIVNILFEFVTIVTFL